MEGLQPLNLWNIGQGKQTNERANTEILSDSIIAPTFKSVVVEKLMAEVITGGYSYFKAIRSFLTIQVIAPIWFY